MGGGGVRTYSGARMKKMQKRQTSAMLRSSMAAAAGASVGFL
jgi:hypothetical protein